MGGKMSESARAENEGDGGLPNPALIGIPENAPSVGVSKSFVVNVKSDLGGLENCALS